MARLLSVLLLGTLLVPADAQQPRPYRILVTNDDGVRAPTLAIVAEALRAVGEAAIVAPSENQTGKSQSLNMLEPIFREDVKLPSGLAAVGLTATSATTVQVGIKNVLPARPDVVVSGINPGYNLGFSAHLSGTVGAARQAVMEALALLVGPSRVTTSARFSEVTTRRLLRGLGPIADSGMDVARLLIIAKRATAATAAWIRYLKTATPPRGRTHAPRT